jgi:hypothetical protein
VSTPYCKTAFWPFWASVLSCVLSNSEFFIWIFFLGHNFKTPSAIALNMSLVTTLKFLKIGLIHWYLRAPVTCGKLIFCGWIWGDMKCVRKAIMKLKYTSSCYLIVGTDTRHELFPELSVYSGTLCQSYDKVTTLKYIAAGISIAANNGRSAQPIRTIFCGFEGFHWLPKWSECVSRVQSLFLYLTTIVSANYCEICSHIHVLRLKRFLTGSLRKPPKAFRWVGGGRLKKTGCVVQTRSYKM